MRGVVRLCSVLGQTRGGDGGWASWRSSRILVVAGALSRVGLLHGDTLLRSDERNRAIVAAEAGCIINELEGLTARTHRLRRIDIRP